MLSHEVKHALIEKVVQVEEIEEGCDEDDLMNVHRNLVIVIRILIIISLHFRYLIRMNYYI